MINTEFFDVLQQIETKIKTLDTPTINCCQGQKHFLAKRYERDKIEIQGQGDRFLNARDRTFSSKYQYYLMRLT